MTLCRLVVFPRMRSVVALDPDVRLIPPQKHPLKIQQFNKQNPAAWLNSLAQMKQRGAGGVPPPSAAGAALKGVPPQPFGPPFCGGGPPHHACGGGPPHPGWQGHHQGHPQGHPQGHLQGGPPQEVWGSPYGPGHPGVPRGGPPSAAMVGRVPHGGGCGPPNGGCFPPAGAYQGAPMGCGAAGNPAQMGAGESPLLLGTQEGAPSNLDSLTSRVEQNCDFEK